MVEALIRDPARLAGGEGLLVFGCHIGSVFHQGIIAVLRFAHQTKPALDGSVAARRRQGGRDDGCSRPLWLAPGRALLPRLEPPSRARLRGLSADHAVTRAPGSIDL